MNANTRNTPLQRVAIAALSTAAMLLAVPANAQYYGGISLNAFLQTGFTAAHDDLGVGTLDGGFSTPLVSLRNARTLYGLKFSYPLAANLAIEARYNELARANYGAFPSPVNSVMPRDARNYGLDLVAAAPLLERAAVFGRVGIQSVRTDKAFAIPSSIDLTNLASAQASTAARFGVGIRYDFSNSIGLRLEAEHFRRLSGSAIGDLNSDNYSFGIQLKF